MRLVDLTVGGRYRTSAGLIVKVHDVTPERGSAHGVAKVRVTIASSHNPAAVGQRMTVRLPGDVDWRLEAATSGAVPAAEAHTGLPIIESGKDRRVIDVIPRREWAHSSAEARASQHVTCTGSLPVVDTGGISNESGYARGTLF